MRQQTPATVNLLLAAAATTFLLFGAARADAAVRVSGKLTQERPAHPGEEYSHSITLENGGSDAAQVRLYLRDYSFQSDGTNDYSGPGLAARSNASWVRLPSEVVTVAPGSELVVPIWVSVPRDVELGGTYWSVLMVEPTAADNALDGGPQQGVSLRTVMRYGVQLVTNIPGGTAGRLEFFAPQLTERNGAWVFTIDARNIGERWLRPAFRLELFDEAGERVGRFEDTRKRVFPGSSVRFSTAVGSLATGSRYRALAVADGGTEELFGVTLDLTVR